VPGAGRGTAARVAADRRGPEQYGVWRMASLILAVDDSASMRQMVNFTLKGAGYQVVQATDGVEALEYARGNAVDLVLTDVNMPRMDGITLVRELRALATYRYTPMLVLTTESSQEKKMQGKQAGATGWIVKPFNPDQLLATIARVL
jgi:two-component system chemotaxis response regulator CheY